MRVQGKNLTVNQYVQTGSFHTLQIERNKEYEIRKEVWDEGSLWKLREGCERASGTDLAVLLLQPIGLAHVFLVGPRVQTLCSKVEAVSNKTFFENVFSAFVKHVDFGVVRCVVIGSPGSMKEDFRRLLIGEAQRLKQQSKDCRC